MKVDVVKLEGTQLSDAFWRMEKPGFDFAGVPVTWSDLGPVLERERVALSPPSTGDQGLWFAYHGDQVSLREAWGLTPEIAIMRVLLIAKLGRKANAWDVSAQYQIDIP